MILIGWVHNGADEAADFGRGRVPWWVIDVRRNYSGVCLCSLALACPRSVSFFFFRSLPER